MHLVTQCLLFIHVCSRRLLQAWPNLHAVAAAIVFFNQLANKHLYTSPLPTASAEQSISNQQQEQERKRQQSGRAAAMMNEALTQLLSDPGAAAATAAVFQTLKPCCSQLLPLRHDPQQLSSVLQQLLLILSAADPRGLSRCFDYVLFPLSYMLESIASSRTTSGGSSNGGSSNDGSSSSGGRTMAAVPAMTSDKAAEAVLSCLLVLVDRVLSLDADQVRQRRC